MLVILCGLPGTGKSTLAKQIASDNNGVVLRTDIIRGEMFKEATVDKIMKSDNPMLYNLISAFDKHGYVPEKYKTLIEKQKQMVYDEFTGGCHDGLGNSAINMNQGAESTISYLLARLSLEEINNSGGSN